MGLGNSYEAKLMECFTSFEVKDILGFAKIVKVDPEIIKKAILNEIIASDLEKTGIDKFILSDFNIFTKEIIDTQSKLSQLSDSDQDKKAKSDLTAKLKNNSIALKRGLIYCSFVGNLLLY